MRKMLRQLVLLLCCGAGCVACNSDDASDDRYYVRYSVVGESDREVRMGFTDESGETSYVTIANREGCCRYAVGPVREGFEATLVASYTDGGTPDLLTIEVARGQEPFVLKAKGNSHISLRYVVGE